MVLAKGYFGDPISPRDGLRSFFTTGGESRHMMLSGLLRLHDYDEVKGLLIYQGSWGYEGSFMGGQGSGYENYKTF